MRKEISKEEMPREKALNMGISALSNNELLALIIKSACRNMNVFDLADAVIKKADGFSNLFSLSYEELVDIKGIGKAKALEIMAILEIAKRLARISVVSEDVIKSPTKVVELLRTSLGYSNQEEFLVLYLDGKGSIIKNEVLFIGSKNSSIVAPDEVLRKALLYKASALIVAHNHPSGKCVPSEQDIDITRKLRGSCNMMNIPLIDHIIISKSSYFSFRENSLV